MGRAVAERLVQAGAVVTIADIDGERVEQVAADYGVNMAHSDEIAYLPVDIYCPCALGAILNDTTIPKLQCQIVCGSANNQLAEARHGEMLAQRGILYAPDYIVNAGGALWSIQRLAPGGFDRQRAQAAVALGRIGPAAKTAVPTLIAALAEANNPGLRDHSRDALAKMGAAVLADPLESISATVCGISSDRPAE